MISPTLTIEAKPYAYTFPVNHTALLVIDMQRDFLLPGGFGGCQGSDMTDVVGTIPYVSQLLTLFRDLGMHVVHTREGHVPDLSDCPSSKLLRNLPTRPEGALTIGDKGPMGRLLIRGEYGQDIVDELQPLPGELVIDKPGKGAFWNTRLMEQLKHRAITHLVVCGVTTECCFATTIREGNDRGYECCGIVEATAGYNKAFKTSSLDMLNWAGGLFGFVTTIAHLAEVMEPLSRNRTPITPPMSNATTNGVPTTNGTSTISREYFQDTTTWNGDLSIHGLADAYKRGLSITDFVEKLYEKIEDYHKVNPAVWIQLEPKEKVIEAGKLLESKYPNRKALPPLFGVPFSVKDSLDVEGIPTTTACPPLAFTPSTSAVVYEKVIAEGALYIGKTNLDQLATGLTGCRSPFGIPTSVFSKDFISGGSSSGNAVSVGAGLVTFSLATDTAGSGRVPALFNSVIGFKPTRGTLSAQGLTPACPSLDCIALMAKTAEDVRKVWWVCEGYDADDVYAKWAISRLRQVNSLGPQVSSFRFGIPPPEVLAVCCPAYQAKFKEAIETLQSMGGKMVPIDWSPFEKGGNLLYEGTFVSERLAALPDGWFETNREHLHPVIREIFEKVIARNSTAIEAYRDLMAKALYTRQAEQVLSPGTGGIDVLVVPTAPIHWTIEEVQADPIARNSHLGTFTHFGNVLDMTAVAIPAGTYDVSELGDRAPLAAAGSKLPFGITLLGMSGTDAEILEIARRFGEALE